MRILKFGEISREGSAPIRPFDPFAHWRKPLEGAETKQPNSTPTAKIPAIPFNADLSENTSNSSFKAKPPGNDGDDAGGGYRVRGGG